MSHFDAYFRCFCGLFGGTASSIGGPERIHRPFIGLLRAGPERSRPRFCPRSHRSQPHRSSAVAMCGLRLLLRAELPKTPTFDI